ncbi:MCE family protein [Amycolatopsis palatopharyngis]|uniref:MCE family protein n=1 Tax=Amycolatopsis palatopharyngis TaxID=187982 RepID=UPI001B886E37|nr:MCE family protein [Amycolatopsis palatopharyngis]
MSTKESLITLRRRLLGLALIVVLVGGIALSIALYNKSFSNFVNVTLRAESLGNQLIERSDVKVRGLIVGSVHDISVTPTGAEMSLRLDPASAELIPANVSARLLPKTLFGERFVALQIPESPSPDPIRDGDVISQDRTSSAIELEQAFETLMPVLQAVQPQKLSSTLTAISTSLQGRGKPFGEMMSELGVYFGDLNPHLPELQHNLQALADFSENFADAAPDLVQMLDNFTVTSRTLVEKRQNLQALYGSLTTASMDLQAFLQANSDNIISLGETSRPTLELLEKYAPEYPCVLRQLSEVLPKIDETLGKGTSQPGLHATIEVTVNRGPYEPGRDEPEFNDKRGPRCYDIKDFPQPFPQHPPEGPIKDGSTSPPAARSQNDGLNPPANAAEAGGYNGGGSTAGNPAYTAAEHGFLAQLLGPQLGVAPEDVPGWSGLLVGPLYRGAEVNFS